MACFSCRLPPPSAPRPCRHRYPAGRHHHLPVLGAVQQREGADGWRPVWLMRPHGGAPSPVCTHCRAAGAVRGPPLAAAPFRRRPATEQQRNSCGRGHGRRLLARTWQVVPGSPVPPLAPRTLTLRCVASPTATQAQQQAASLGQQAASLPTAAGDGSKQSGANVRGVDGLEPADTGSAART